MKTAAIVIFTLDLLTALYSGFANVTQEKFVDLEDLEIKEEGQRAVDWQPYIGIGMMVMGGAFLVLSRKKSLTT